MRSATRLAHNGWPAVLLMAWAIGAAFAEESAPSKPLPPIPTTWHEGPATPEHMNQRLDQAASQAQGHGPVPRLVLYDIAYPETPEEYSNTGGQAVMLITAVSHKKSELPLKNVRIAVAGGEVSLKRLRSVLSDMSHSRAPAVMALGQYREDALYVLPVSLRLNGTAMLLDFSKNESDARLPFGPLPESIASLATVQGGVTASVDGLDQFIKKEFPSFFKE